MMILATIPEKVASTVFWSSVGWVDVVLVVAFLIGVFLGLRKGLSVTLARLIEVIVAQVIVMEYTAVLTTFLSTRFQIPTRVFNIIIFALLTAVSIVTTRFVFQLLSLIANLEFKQPLKNLGGALVGGIRFVLIFALLAEFLMLFPVPFLQESFLHKSLAGPHLIHLSDQFRYFFERWIPASLRA